MSSLSTQDNHSLKDPANGESSGRLLCNITVAKIHLIDLIFIRFIYKSSASLESTTLTDNTERASGKYYKMYISIYRVLKY